MSRSLDLPGIVEGASAGRGRGRQVVSTAKTSDLIIMMLDATKSVEQRRLLEIELDAVGIRLNKSKPDGELPMHHTSIHLSACIQLYSSKRLRAG
jgi:ribosome-interacting GTPase 1